jgi:hypothetical protein
MKAKELKKLLETVPDDAEIVRSGPDHSYERARAVVTTAMQEKDGGRRATLWEDYQDLNPEELTASSTRIQVVLIQ